jgi:hypothetical protein
MSWHWSYLALVFAVFYMRWPCRILYFGVLVFTVGSLGRWSYGLAPTAFIALGAQFQIDHYKVGKEYRGASRRLDRLRTDDNSSGSECSEAHDTVFALLRWENAVEENYQVAYLIAGVLVVVGLFF